MKQNLNRTLTKLRTTFMSFTMGQRLVTVVGTLALVLAAFMVFQWVSTPNYAPLYSSLASEDASAVVDELEAQGVPYKLEDGGSTIMVPRDDVYSTRIDLSGQGLPANSGEGGYQLLDGHDISTSDFQEQTDFKRAMEGELAKTIEAVDGVNTAVVHLAMPEKKVFADEQEPTTASVLIDTKAGDNVDAEKVQAIVNLVSSSIDGLDPANVSIADSTGKVLTNTDGTGLGSGTRDQAVTDFQTKKTQQIQTMLDEVLGAGNSTVQVSADLNFDKSIEESTTYSADEETPPLSESTTEETYNGTNGSGGSTGVVGPDGQMDSFGTATGAGSGSGDYSKKSSTKDNAVETTKKHVEAAPGNVRSLHVGVVLDSAAAVGIDAAEVQELIADTVGINAERGDTVSVKTMAFDRAADQAAAQELAAAAKAKADAKRWSMIRNGGIALALLAMVLLAWLRARRGKKAREERTAYLVEQLRNDAAERAAAAAALEPAAPVLSELEMAQQSANDEMRRELAALAERQPEEIATLLRGWLVERSS